MSASSKIVLFLAALICGYLLVVHGSRALNASLPNDMPRDAHFIQTGYDVTRNEAQGQWIACRNDHDENSDFCRVTDPHGIVVYQGFFIPYDFPAPLPNDQLQIAPQVDRLWVDGPADGGPIPVIPLRNGKLLVPTQDREALADRWRRNPTEFRQIIGMQLP